MEHHHKGRAANARDRREVANEIEVQICIERRVDRVRRDGKEQRVAVRRAPNWAVPEETAGSRRTPTHVTRGAISLSSSNHLPPMPYSKIVNPVALPPGRAKLSTKPPPTG